MDRVDFYKRIEGKQLHITKNGLHLETEPVRISLDGEIQWKNNVWRPDWEHIANIEEEQDMEYTIFSFRENGEEVLVTVFEW